uniref:Putative dna-directed rna polymerase iii subunit rpc7-like protein n=1 Tax=Ixodes ricinus TaxID=34613 RepID=A0A0K8RHM0_IXORI
MSFNVEQLGLTRADAALPPILQPPPAYPPLEFSPAPLVNSEENIYLAALLRDQRRNMFESGFNVQPLAPPQLVERYSDRYQAPKAPEVVYDLSYFPAELRSTKKVQKSVPKVYQALEGHKLGCTKEAAGSGRDGGQGRQRWRRGGGGRGEEGTRDRGGGGRGGRGTGRGGNGGGDGLRVGLFRQRRELSRRRGRQPRRRTSLLTTPRWDFSARSVPVLCRASHCK